MATCKICRREIPFGQGVLIQARGKALFTVHADPCATQVKNGFGVASRLVLLGLRAVLQAKAPGALGAIQTVQRVIALGGGNDER